MPDLLEMLKLSNIFGPMRPEDIVSDHPNNGGISGNLPRPRENVFDIGDRTPSSTIGRVKLGEAYSPGPSPNEPSVPLNGKSNNLLEEFTPETFFSDEFKKAYGERPERPNPGKVKRILAGIVGGFARDPKAVNNILYGGYDRDVADWKTRLDQIQPGLQAERYANVNERTLLNQQRGRELEEGRLRLSQSNAAAKQDLDNRKLALQQFKADNPNYKFETGEDGFIYAVNPQNPKDVIKTEIKSGELSEFDKIRLNLSSAITRIGVQSEANKELEEVRSLNREEIANFNRDTQIQLATMRAELAGQNRWSNPVQAFDREGKPLPFMISANGVTGETKQIPLTNEAVVRPTPPGASDTTESESQKKQGLINKANEVINQHPEWKMYIDVTSSGVNVKPVGTGILNKDLTEETRNSILDAIGIPRAKTAETVKPKDAPKPKAEVPIGGNSSEDRVKIKDKTGKVIGTIPRAQLAQALKQGYTEAK